MFTRWWTGDSPGRNRGGRAALASLLALSLITASGCSMLPKEDAEEVLPSIHPPKLSKKPEYTVKTGTMVTKVTGSGKLMSEKEEEVYFTEDNKRIKAIHVNAGDTVQAGQVIAELDVADVQSTLRMKRLEARSEELKMIQLLRDSGDKTAEEMEQARIAFEMKREELTKLEESIANSKIVAPFAGTVVSVYKKKGDQTKAYEAVALIADLSKLTVAANLSAEDLKKVAVGMEVEVDINTAGKQKGTIRQLPNPNASGQQTPNRDPYGYMSGDSGAQDSIDKYVLIDLEKMPENLSRGTPLSVSVIVQKKENVLIIPPSALRSAGGRQYVQVVDEKGEKREVDVEVGLRSSTEVEIVKGLAAGQKVVGK